MQWIIIYVRLAFYICFNYEMVCFYGFHILVREMIWTI